MKERKRIIQVKPDAVKHLGRCNAVTRQGYYCRNWPEKNGRCAFHGGKSLGGVDSPTFKHGRYSKYMPANLLDRYQESLGDPDLLNLSSEIAVIDSRISELLAQVNTGEAGALWRKARKLTGDIMKALANEDYGQLVVVCNEMDRAIGAGLFEFEAWDQIASFIEQRRKLADAQHKHLIDQEQMITANRALTWMTASGFDIREVIEKECPPELATRLKRQIGAIIADRMAMQRLPAVVIDNVPNTD